jgi:pimeloyl-ACP methyl ester carboxylesterase
LWLSLLGVAGCASLADLIAEPEGKPLLDARTLGDFERATRMTRSSLPAAEGVRIAYARVPAMQRHYRYTAEVRDGVAHFNFKVEGTPRPLPVRGSVVYLHGWGMEGSSLYPWALSFSEQGYVGYVVDLRNHGRSGRAPVGFGTREATDVVSVLGQLREHGQLREPVFLFGVSLGATTALFAEPALQGQVDGIVALEPFVNARDAIDGVIQDFMDARPQGWRNRVRQAVARWRHGATEADRQSAIAEAGRRLDLDLDAVDLGPVAARLRTCTLLLHGEKDAWIDPAVSRELSARSPVIHFTSVPRMDHLTLPMRVDWLARPILEWLAHVGEGRCEAMELPPDPL